MSHTPGPWVHHPEDNIITTHEGRLTLEWQARSNHRLSGQMSISERDANARLIAASPDLLAALEAIVKLDDGDWPGAWEYPTEFEAARAALAKAKE